MNSKYIGNPETDELEYEIKKLNRVIVEKERELEKLRNKESRFDNLTAVYLDKDFLNEFNLDVNYESMDLYFENHQHYEDFFDGITQIVKRAENYKKTLDSLQEKINLIFDEEKHKG